MAKTKKRVLHVGDITDLDLFNYLMPSPSMDSIELVPINEGRGVPIARDDMLIEEVTKDSNWDLILVSDAHLDVLRKFQTALEAHPDLYSGKTATYSLTEERSTVESDRHFYITISTHQAAMEGISALLN